MPDSVNKLTAAGIEVLVQAGAGENAYFLDDAYVAAGATIAPDAQTLFASADIIVKVQRPDSVDPLSQLRNAGADELWQHDPLVDQDLTQALHAAGKRLYVWTVDDPDRVEQLASWDVDGVCTNKPDVVRRKLT